MNTPPLGRRLVCVAMVMACLRLGPAVWAEDAVRPGTGERAPLVVIGASASAGFVSSEPFGGPKTPQYRFSRYLTAAFLHPGTPAKSFATPAFFLAAEEQARKQIDGALALKPSAVIGIDFLFWFCYGKAPGDNERGAKFEKGLAFLDRLDCPLVIGDIPDASGAVGGMLDANEVPKPEVIAAANRRLAEWASSHKNVSLVSLSEFLSACSADRALSFGPLTWPEGQTRKLLQSDKLHPARHGCAVLALAVMNALAKERGLFPENEVCWDVNEVYRRALETPSTPAPAIPAVKAPEPAGQ